MVLDEDVVEAFPELRTQEQAMHMALALILAGMPTILINDEDGMPVGRLYPPRRLPDEYEARFN